MKKFDKPEKIAKWGYSGLFLAVALALFAATSGINQLFIKLLFYTLAVIILIQSIYYLIVFKLIKKGDYKISKKYFEYIEKK